MKVDFINGKIVCIAADWNKLGENERKFLSECYWRGIWGDFDENGHLPFRTPDTAQEIHKKLCHIVQSGEWNKVEITDGVFAIKDKYEPIAEKERNEWEAARQAVLRQEKWESRKKNGCGGCKHCMQIGDGWFRCLYSGDELDSRMYNEYNYVTNVYEMFHEMGEPNEHCKDYVEVKTKVFGG